MTTETKKPGLTVWSTKDTHCRWCGVQFPDDMTYSAAGSHASKCQLAVLRGKEPPPMIAKKK